ncbi:hypothetical protein [Massilia sp. S19_KUP03_FR1]|uniref:hypothetical protein n=1 Tax=Massilia sp. S19_KUP03_FR1 TaxID=3025503 RepID=UPI002FCDBFFF
MKSSILRTGLALACAVSLASCGGGNTGTLYLAGNFSGVTLDGLILQNNGGADLAIAGVSPGGSGSFQFKDLVPSDSIYNVTVKARPSNTEKCSVANGSGNTGLYSVGSVVVTCVIFTHKLSGTVTGLGNAGANATDKKLVLVNGSNQVTVTPAADSGNVTFSMAPVSQDYPYGITVLTQPTGKTCTVTKGIDKMGLVDILPTNADGTPNAAAPVVTCTPASGA